MVLCLLLFRLNRLFECFILDDLPWSIHIVDVVSSIPSLVLRLEVGWLSMGSHFVDLLFPKAYIYIRHSYLH